MKLPHRFWHARLDVATAGLEVVLRAGRPLGLVGGHGRFILCTSGCAWVTAPGVRDDIFLEVGQTWAVASRGRVLIEAIGDATVVIGAMENRRRQLWTSTNP